MKDVATQRMDGNLFADGVNREIINPEELRVSLHLVASEAAERATKDNEPAQIVLTRLLDGSLNITRTNTHVVGQVLATLATVQPGLKRREVSEVMREAIKTLERLAN